MASSSFVDIFVVGILFCLGLLFWVYGYVRLRLKRLAAEKYRGRPVALFLLGILFFFAASAMVFGVFALLHVFHELPRFFRGSLLLGISAVGGIGLIMLLIQRFGTRTERARFEKEHPLPRLQFWMQDLFAVVFCFGIYMAMLSRLGNWVSNDTPSAFPLAAFVLLAMGAGMYVALDLCRRSRRLQKPLPRLLLVFGLVSFTALTVLIPVWLSWLAWRYALYESGWVLDKDREQEQAHGRNTPWALEAEA